MDANASSDNDLSLWLPRVVLRGGVLHLPVALELEERVAVLYEQSSVVPGEALGGHHCHVQRLLLLHACMHAHATTRIPLFKATSAPPFPLLRLTGSLAIVCTGVLESSVFRSLRCDVL